MVYFTISNFWEKNTDEGPLSTAFMSGINLFEPQHMSGPTESCETLLACRNVMIERIQSPAGTRSELYIQDQDEWVCLVQGKAQLEMGEETVKLTAGETLFIPAGTPHRVVDTSDNPTCIWLTVHIHP